MNWAWIYLQHKVKFHPGFLRTVNDKVCLKAFQNVVRVSQITMKQTVLKKILYSRRNRQIRIAKADSRFNATQGRFYRELEVVQYIQPHLLITSPTIHPEININHLHHHSNALNCPTWKIEIWRHPTRQSARIRRHLTRESARDLRHPTRASAILDGLLRLTPPPLAPSHPYPHQLIPLTLLPPTSMLSRPKEPSKAYHGQECARMDDTLRLTLPLLASPLHHLNFSIPWTLLTLISILQ